MFPLFSSTNFADKELHLQFEGYFRDQKRFGLRCGSSYWVVRLKPDGSYTFSERLGSSPDALALMLGVPIEEAIEVIRAFAATIPEVSEDSPHTLIIQPFHIPRNPWDHKMPGLEECDSTGAVVALVKRLWPDAQCYEGGHHVRADLRRAGVIEIHETWDERTCLGSYPPKNPRRGDDQPDTIFDTLGRKLARMFV